MQDTARFSIAIVEEDELPKGHCWAIVRQPPTKDEPSRKWLFIKTGYSSADLIEAREAIHQLHLR